MKLTNFFSLSTQDFIKGLLMAVLGAVISIIAPSLQSGKLIFDWSTIWHTAIATALAYLAKNLFSPAPKTIQIDPSKTTVIDGTSKNKNILINSTNNSKQ